MKILCVRSRKKKKKQPIKSVRRMCVATGQTLPFPAGGEVWNYLFIEKRVFLSAMGQQFLLGEMLGFEDRLSDSSGLGAGSGPAPPWSLFIPPPSLPAGTNPSEKTQPICASSLITDRCLFGPLMVLVSFFPSHLTVGLLACVPLCSLEQSGFG